MRISDWSSDECSSYLFRSLNLCHRERLATQSQDAFRQWVPESPLTTCIARDGNFDQSADNVYALVQTAAARVDEIKNYDVGADRKSVVSGKSVSVRVDLGGRRIINKKNRTMTIERHRQKEVTHMSATTLNIK